MAPDEIKYPELRIEPELMDQLRDIVKRREEVLQLVEKAEGNKAKVKPAIYSKVLADYKNRLKAINGEFVPVSEKVKKSLEDVQKRETDIRARLQEVNDDLEEQRFRCQIGEFPKKELDPIETEMGQVQEELNEQIKVLENTYEECSRCLSEPPAEPAPAAPASAPEPVKVPSDARAPVPPPPSDKAKSNPSATAPNDAAAEQELPEIEPLEEPDGEAEPAVPSCALRLLKKDGDPEDFPLLADKLSIGRSPKSDIVLKVAGVSRTHAHVVRTSKDQFTIIDTSGGGGVTINGKKLKKAALKIGDRIDIASIELEVVEK